MWRIRPSFLRGRVVFIINTFNDSQALLGQERLPIVAAAVEVGLGFGFKIQPAVPDLVGGIFLFVLGCVFPHKQ